jgi:hypothetical protein
MVDEVVSPDGNAKSGAEDPSQALAMTQQQESLLGLMWPWPTLILVQRMPSADDPNAQHDPWLLAPNRRGLELIESLDTSDIQSISIVRWTQEGQLIAESVKHVRSWGLRLLADREESLTVLLCVSGAAFVVDEDGLFEVDEVLRQWFADGKYKPAGKFLEVFTVEAVVVALLPESQVAKIHTADGREYLLSRYTDGGCFDALDEGTRVKCVVTRRPPVVLSASVLGHTNIHETGLRPATQAEHG